MIAYFLDEKMKKNHNILGILIPAMLLAGFFALHFIPLALAQTGFAPPSVLPGEDIGVEGYGDVCIGLATMIRTGEISLRQIPCFIKYFAQTLIALAGSISVIFVMIGGYQYMFSSGETEQAKRTITHALIGLAVSLLAWVLVDIVLQLATE